MPEPGGGGGAKRVAPISSSAFSFSLGTPAKKPRGGVDRTPAPVGPPPSMTPVGRAGPSSARRAVTSLQFATPTRSGHVPATSKSEGKRPVTRLDALPSPHLRLPPSAAGDDGSPAPRAREHRRLTSVFEDEASPFRLRGTERRELHGISAMPRPAVGAATPAAAVETDEGVGVSPRRFKGSIQHRGAGPPPSVRLAALVSAANTSLVLFYTSLQQTLYPSLSKRRIHPCAAHIASAPIRLRVDSVVPGATHAAVVALCSVLRWHAPNAPATATVVFQALPPDCPRLGVDPRVLADLPDKTFEAGVFLPCNDTTAPAPLRDNADGSAPGNIQAVLFASRYLVVDVDSPL